MAMPFSQMNPHAHHPGLGPGAMHSNDQDISPAEFFSSGGAQQQMGGGSHGMQNMNTLSTSTSWGGAATQPSETNWFGPGDSAMSLGGRDAMPHTVSAPSLGMLQHQQQPVQSAPTMGGGPMMQNSMSQSQGHMGVSNWQSGNHSTQSAPPGNEGGAGAGGDLEERLKEIMNQSKAAMSTPVNFHTMSAQMSGQASMDSTGGTRDGMEVGPESASRMSAQHYPGNSQPSPIQEEMDDSRVLTVAEHCPAVLMRPHWSVKQFNLQNLLYMGNNSRVLRAVDKHTGITVALKVYNKNKLSDMEKYQVAREIRMHSQLLHENIVRLYCAWKDSQFIHVAEEYAPHGDIYSLLKPRNAMAPVGVAENFVVTKIFRPLLSALSFIHARGLIHRDLKPENILLGEDNNIKLTDFGLSINQELEVANTRLGTLNYIAPEILKCPFKQHPLENKGSDSFGYDNKVDVWSLGVLAYELLTAELPFSGGSMRVTLERIMRNEVLYPSYVSPLARDFMSRCLQSNPRARPSVDELRQHHWICQRYDMEA